MSKNSKTRKRSIHLLKDITPRDDRLLSRKIARSIPKEKNDVELFYKKLTKSMGTRSYSPSINKKLRSIYMSDYTVNDVFACTNIQSILQSDVPLVPVYINGKKQCLHYRDKESQKLLIDRILTVDPDPAKVVPPRQYQSNCWFNTFFVTFFISDKGHKFFRYFRKLMVTGIREGGSKIDSLLWDVFARLNFAIESCYKGDDSAYGINTNILINGIHMSIKKRRPDLISEFPKSGYKDENLSMPLEYYESIMRYLGDDTVRMFGYNCYNADYNNDLMQKLSELKYVPHIIYVFKPPDTPRPIHRKEIVWNNVTYVIDSIVINPSM